MQTAKLDLSWETTWRLLVTCLYIHEDHRRVWEDGEACGPKTYVGGGHSPTSTCGRDGGGRMLHHIVSLQCPCSLFSAEVPLMSTCG